MVHLGELMRSWRSKPAHLGEPAQFHVIQSFVHRGLFYLYVIIMSRTSFHSEYVISANFIIFGPK